MHRLDVTMFGDFTVRSESGFISDTDNRSKKVWVLLACLIYNRHRVMKQNELIELLWRENERGVNPTGALKTLFYRVRAELDKLWDGAGKELILYQKDGYFWNPDIQMTLDYEEFDAFFNNASQKNTDNIDTVYDILKIYNGEFLRSMPDELWIMPITAYYHNAYIAQLQHFLPVMLEAQKYAEIVSICRSATEIEPYSENLYSFYMRAYLGMGEQQKALNVYRDLSDRLLSDLGIMPSDNVRSLYRTALKTNNEHALSLGMLQEQLRESQFTPGALVCDYDFFRVLYYSMARSIARSGIAVHIVLISASERDGSVLPLKRLEKIMSDLEECIRTSLRRGDSAARCSGTQYVIMLPRANYENSCMVSERISRAYSRKHPASGVSLRCEVYPMQPDDKENIQWIREKSND